MNNDNTTGGERRDAIIRLRGINSARRTTVDKVTRTVWPNSTVVHLSHTTLSDVSVPDVNTAERPSRMRAPNDTVIADTVVVMPDTDTYEQLASSTTIPPPSFNGTYMCGSGTALHVGSGLITVTQSTLDEKGSIKVKPRSRTTWISAPYPFQFCRAEDPGVKDSNFFVLVSSATELSEAAGCHTGRYDPHEFFSHREETDEETGEGNQAERSTLPPLLSVSTAAQECAGTVPAVLMKLFAADKEYGDDFEDLLGQTGVNSG